jgi:GNAT superfamily N-acetyltransferase
MTAPDPRPIAPRPFSIHAGYTPGAIGRIGQLHGRYYGEAWGTGAAYEGQMLRELCDFMDDCDPVHRLLLTAHDGDDLVGSIAFLGQRDSRQVRLRFFIVDPACHGRGVGKGLLEAGLAWCRARAFDSVWLWTVEGLPASRALYERSGFRVVERVHDARYSVPLTSLKMLLALGADGLS